jgi:predicted permease
MFHKEQLAHELNEEVESHLEMLVEENRRKGMSADDARNTALREFGGVTQVREKYREMSGLRFMETLSQDVRFSFRMLRRNPGFTIVVVLLLGLGIGVNTSIFSLIDAVMLRLLPVKQPQQLVMLNWISKDFPRDLLNDYEGNNTRDENTGLTINYSFSYPSFEHIRDHNQSFASTFAFAGNSDEVNVGLNGHADNASLQAVSGDFFEGMGVQAMLGRMITRSDDKESAPPVAVVSYSFWQRKLGQDAAIAGKSIVVNGSPLTIIGVAPPEFFGYQLGDSRDLWIPLSLYSSQQAQLGNLNNNVPIPKDAKTWWVQISGRMKPGVTQNQVRAEMAVLFGESIQLSNGHPLPESQAPKLGITSFQQGSGNSVDKFSQPLFLLMAMVGLVLLIACANVAGLLLARATARQREIAVRLSLGAGRLRLVRQLLTESIILAMMGGTAGLLLAVWANSSLLALLSGGGKIPVGLQLHLDKPILGFTIAISILSGILFGLTPAFRATRADLLGLLKQSAATMGGAGRRFTSGKVLAGGQVALSLLLLISAGLCVRTLQKLEAVDIGFDRQNLLLFKVRPGLNGYKDTRLAGFYQELHRRIQSVPGVRSVGFSQRGPIGQGMHTTTGSISGYTQPGQLVDVSAHTVGPNYFDTFGIPVVLGRPIGPQDDQAAPHVIVVNQKLVHDYFHNDNPIGHRFNFGSAAKPREYEIVGVAKDVKYGSVRRDVPPTVYFPYLQRQSILNFMTFEVRAAGDVNNLVGAIQKEAHAVDKDIPLVDIRTETDVIDETLVLQRAFATLSTTFGILALLLACVGLYGTMAYTVARRTNEIGIRMALGAARGTILGMVLRETLTVVASGLVIGLPLAWAATRLLQNQLFGLSAHDPFTMIAATFAIVAVTVIAGYLPARRASRVDPMVALRYE